MAGQAKDTTDAFVVEDEREWGRRELPLRQHPGLRPALQRSSRPSSPSRLPAASRAGPDAEEALEEDPRRLAQRQKQIDIGKNSLGYQNYRATVDREARHPKKHPATPDVHQVTSKRAFDGQVRKWRRMLHDWDPEGPAMTGVAGAVGGGPASSNAPAPSTNGGGRGENHQPPGNAAQRSGRSSAASSPSKKKRGFDQVVRVSEALLGGEGRGRGTGKRRGKGEGGQQTVLGTIYPLWGRALSEAGT